ncbi:heavy-metal-associated domain-containing protein [Noviherbaspirillum sp. ST9]|uniref:heavy-metal-associated domain-containing protein n=1 Tax=Noviherbaspirillum sp. ST9 TaxID=3401606 RepID=UPI003B58B148
MQSEVFQFRAATTQESMAHAVRVLSGVAGVRDVTPSILRNEVSVQFNAELTSKQDLQAVLADAGYPIQTGSRGGCGGGGGGCSCS